MKTAPFEESSDNTKFFNLLKDEHPMKKIFLKMLSTSGEEKCELEKGAKITFNPVQLMLTL